MVVAAVVGVQRPVGVVLDRHVHADAGAVVALADQHRQSAGGVRVQGRQDQFPGGGQVVGRARPDVGDPQHVINELAQFKGCLAESW